MDDLEAQLRTYGVRELIVALRLMRASTGGTVGFDYSKVLKPDLLEYAIWQARALSPSARSSVISNLKRSFGWKPPELIEKASGKGASGAGTDTGMAKMERPGWIESDDGDYAPGGDLHGQEQRGGGKDEGKDVKGKAGSKFEEAVSRVAERAMREAAKEAKAEAKSAADQAKKEAAEAAKEAAREAAKEAAEKAAKDAVEGKTDELMERLSKTIFRIEITEDAGGGNESSEGDGGTEEGQEEKDKRTKKTRTIDATTPRHVVFQEVCQAVNAGLNVLLVGPAGCGKTHMAEDVAKTLGLPFRFTGAVSSEYKLLGFITAQGALVRTEYREAYENGGVFLWDELDASSAQALLSFNAGLANGHQDFPDKVVDQRKSFRAIASANTYGHGADRMYIGRNQLDAASLDRFYVVNMDYDEQLEQAFIAQKLFSRKAFGVDVAGAYPIVPVAVAGDPMCMSTPDPDSIKTKPIVRLIVNVSVSGNVPRDVIYARGGAILAWIDEMEKCGYRCEIMVVEAGLFGSQGNSPKGVMFMATGKLPEEPLDIDRMSFLLCHSAVQRRVFFSLYETDKVFEETVGLTKAQLMTYGQPTDDLPPDWLGAHSVYFPALRKASADWANPAFAAAAVERIIAKNLQIGDVEEDANFDAMGEAS